MNKILLTGSTGFIGSALLKDLSHDNKVYVILRKKLKKKLNDKNIIPIYFNNYQDLNKKICKLKIDTVIHCATHYIKEHNLEDIRKLAQSNILFGNIILENLNIMNVKIFIVGAPKAGTTSLHHYLNEHPDVLMSEEKEPDYFSNKELSDQGLYYGTSQIDNEEKYHNLFKNKKNEQILGEASVSYLFYPEVPQRIKNYNPEAKIIIMLRNPVDRAFSHYLMDYRLGLTSESFDDIFKKKSELKFQQYFVLGNYSSQIINYFNVFGKENIHIILYSDFKKNTPLELEKVFDFLSLNTNYSIDFNKVHNSFSMPKNNIVRKIYSIIWLRKVLVTLVPFSFISLIKSILFNKENKPKLSVEVRNSVSLYFEKDIEILEKLLSINLEKWKK